MLHRILNRLVLLVIVLTVIFLVALTILVLSSEPKLTGMVIVFPIPVVIVYGNLTNVEYLLAPTLLLLLLSLILFFIIMEFTLVVRDVIAENVRKSSEHE